MRLSTSATLPFPGGPSKVPPLPEGVLQLDFNYDFKTDLVLAGAGGVRLFRQDSPSAFADVTAETKLPKSVLNARYTGAWAVDIEADGDLDIVLGSNDGDAGRLEKQWRWHVRWTFVPLPEFRACASLPGPISTATAIRMPRSSMPRGAFTSSSMRGRASSANVPCPPDLATITAIAVADANNDGALDLLAVQADGAIVRISDKNEGQGWDVAEIAKVPNAADLSRGRGALARR